MKLQPKRWLPVAILMAGLAVVALLVATRPVVEPEPPETRVPLIRAVPVQPQPLQFTVRAHGTVVPRTESELVPQVSGEVVWVSPALNSGGFFEAGDPLVRIDPADTEADLESARAAAARAVSEERLARKDRERQRRLADRSAASQSRIDDAENAYRVAAATVREARARLARTERDLERTTLKAPYTGRVRMERVDPGQFVARGESIATLYAVDFAEVRLPIPDRELSFLDLRLVAPRRAASAATPAEEDVAADDVTAESAEAAPAAARIVESPAAPAVVLSADFAGAIRTWNGSIVRTEGEIDAKSRMVNVVARVEDPYAVGPGGDDVPLAVGLFVEAEIQGRRVPNAVVLPRTALREGDRVLVVQGGDRLRFRDVELLRTEGEFVVVGGGLEAGERVCVSPLRGAIDGMPVRVVDAEPVASPDLARVSQ